jgi:CBS domain-containing protein
MSALRNAGDLCSRDVVTVLRSTAVNEAARVLRDRHVGSLVVVDETAEGRLVAGMLTDRDIVTAVVASEVSPLMLRVGDVMSEDITTVHEDASLHSAIALLRRRRVRRMPVVTSAGMLVGVLSADDLLKLLADELQALAAALLEQRQVEQMVRP